jgi:N-acetylglucosamine-6-phosphate deacetylase
LAAVNTKDVFASLTAGALAGASADAAVKQAATFVGSDAATAAFTASTAPTMFLTLSILINFVCSRYYD